MPFAPEPLSVVSYATRNHAFTSACTWRLIGAELQRDDGAGPPHVFRLADVVRCTLDFRPTRADRNCFRCRLTLRTGVRIEILNRLWEGPMRFTDRSADYVAFVRALTSALSLHAPSCRYHAGTSPLHYVLNVLATGFIALCLAAIAYLLSRVGLTWVIALKLVLLLLYVPTLVLWLTRNRPRQFAATAIPADVLPTAPPPDPA